MCILIYYVYIRSFGTVYKVQRQLDETAYVLKSIRIIDLSYQEQLDAINEVKLLSLMDCKYIVKYYDSFIEKENLNIIMEFCNRGDLQSFLKLQKSEALKRKDNNSTSILNMALKEDIIWNIFLQITCGLYYLHQMKVLHRDLKTANVFLMKDTQTPSNIAGKGFYTVKIGDFGVAKLLDTSTAFAQTIVGTP